jgi:hypothetical protein
MRSRNVGICALSFTSAKLTQSLQASGISGQTGSELRRISTQDSLVSVDALHATPWNPRQRGKTVSARAIVAGALRQNEMQSKTLKGITHTL